MVTRCTTLNHDTLKWQAMIKIQNIGTTNKYICPPSSVD